INADRTQVTFYRDDPAYFGSLQLTFERPLIDSGSDPLVLGLNGPSFECGGWACGGGGTAPLRFVVTDAAPFASAIPDPATWVMAMIGMGFVGYVVRRRGRAQKI